MSLSLFYCIISCCCILESPASLSKVLSCASGHCLITFWTIVSSMFYMGWTFRMHIQQCPFVRKIGGVSNPIRCRSWTRTLQRHIQYSCFPSLSDICNFLKLYGRFLAKMSSVHMFSIFPLLKAIL